MIYLSPPHMSGFEEKYIKEAFDTNWVAPVGPNIDALEYEFCKRMNVKYSVALSSGTAALHLALRVLDIGQGDFVFCSNFTFIASVNPILYQKAIPVLIDSDPESWNMCPKLLSRALNEASVDNKLPKAIIVVGLYGQSPDMKKILEISNHYKIPVIEDSAESLGARCKNVESGTMGKIGIFSFNGNKIITGSGGGMLVSNNSSLAERARKLSTQAREPVMHYEHKELGYNYRMSNVIAGICRGQLKVLDQRVEARRHIFKKYKDMLSSIEDIQWMPEPDWSYSSRWLSCFFIDNDNNFEPRELISFLSLHKIEARLLWKPLHLQPMLEGTRLYSEVPPITGKSFTEKLYDCGVCLPSGSNMTDDDIERITSSVKSFFKKNI
ncbi:DegT/DnrJ/EryC1/StrS family aminotransferase [Gammaproteobacteria bacterium]|nr:DegT/DnrJ/EryC1/StrS family aminotransferase [Gammaproteobacteria bacterium]MDA9101849.1 DegT/DnrJ/EryC1/StrS family aminotransferase [Gammaproteobacteria bacterium]